MEITSFYPVLMVENVAAAARFYRETLGFETTFEADWYVSLRFDGTSWRRIAVPEVYSMENTYDVACPTTTFCAALLNGGSIATYNGTTWNAAAQETGLYDVGDVIDSVREIECPTAYACVVAGDIKVVSSH